MTKIKKLAAVIAVIAVSWLDSKGVGDKERLQLFKKIDDDWKDDWNDN